MKKIIIAALLFLSLASPVFASVDWEQFKKDLQAASDEAARIADEKTMGTRDEL